MTGTFLEKLAKQNQEGRFACAGLDPVEAKMPTDEPWRNKLYKLVIAARETAAAFKPNWAFYLCRKEEGGLSLLRDVCRVIKNSSPSALLVLDMKCGDIGPTNEGYVKWAFDVCNADVITVHSYTGPVAMAPFMRDPARGVFVLCRTSNPGAEEMQEVTLEGDLHYYQYVARQVSERWNEKGNCGLVVGATYPKQLKLVRYVAPDLPLLIPGIGTQGGDLEATLAAVVSHKPLVPFIINQSGSFMHQPTLEESVAKLSEVNLAAAKAVAAVI